MKRSQPDGGFTLIELMIVVAIIAIIAAIAIPGLLRAKLAANESSAVGSLHTISIAEEEFRQTATVDQDGDGQGEYGYLQELAGTVAPRGTSSPVTLGFISLAFGDSAAATGLADKSGYQFLVYLPTAGGAEAEKGSASFNTAAAANANLQELRFICYAWPVAFANTGSRAFAINQTSEVYVTTNTSKKYTGSTTTPAAAAALDGSGNDPANLDSTIGGKSSTTGDGQTWTSAGG